MYYINPNYDFTEGGVGGNGGAGGAFCGNGGGGGDFGKAFFLVAEEAEVAATEQFELLQVRAEEVAEHVFYFEQSPVADNITQATSNFVCRNFIIIFFIMIHKSNIP